MKDLMIKRGLTFLILILTFGKLSAQLPYFKELSVTREMNGLKINSVYQDQQRFIWVGTSNGVFRYDGYNFQFITGSDSTKNPSVNAILRDTSGRLWIGYQDGTIRIYQHDQLELFKPEEGLPKVAITSITSDSTGNIWFATYGEGVYLYNGKRLYNFNTDDGLPDNFVYSITAGRNAKIWCGTDEGIGICSWHNETKKVIKLSQAQGLPDNIVRHVTSDPKGKVWIGMQDRGICYYDIDSSRFVTPPSLSNWTYGGVTTICLLRDKEMWVGTEKSGIIDVELFGSMRVRNCGKPNGTVGNRINELVLDVEGNLWVAANNQLLFSPGEKLEFIHEVNGVDISDIQAILHRNNGELWFSTPTDLWSIDLNHESSSQLQHVFSHNELKNSSILCLYEDRDNNVWIGTFGQGVFYYDSKTRLLKNINEKNGLANDNVLSIAGKNDDVWFATLGGVSRCHLLGSNRISPIETFTEENGLKENYVYNVFIDSKNRVWFATDGKGITVFENNVFRNYSTEVGLKSNVIYSITEDTKGTIWFSTQDAGIYSFDGKYFRNFSIGEGLSEKEISSVKADDEGNLIIVNDFGIDVLQTTSNQLLFYGEESGINEIDPNLNASCKDAEGNIWLGTKSGVIKVRMPSLLHDVKPLTVLNNVKIFLKNIPAGQKHIFSHTDNHVSFDYVGLYFSHPDKVSYEYRLDGYNTDWIKTRDRFITFPNLRPGPYTFRVRSAINNQFETAAVVSFPFTIRKPIWEEPWFYFFDLLVVLSAIYFLIRFREKNLRREEQLKKEHVEFQFETLKSQINPHFLFNSFNTLAALIDEDKETAIAYVDKLSDFYRSILSYKDVDLISLKEECDIAQNYVYLLNQRHGQAFSCIKNLPDDLEKYFIPPLTLQLLIENAVKHNVVSRDHPLTVQVFMKDNDTLVVENNLRLKSQPVPSTQFGLKSISDRFELLGGKPIKIIKTEDYYQVQLKLIKKFNS